ncbi:MAG TPA: hypothetical protein VFP36_04695 [Usitatibacter sp.]|nr:hypothetical protein [Usitatibacter sp.]
MPYDFDDVTVYRFSRLVPGVRDVSPMYMWGTPEAIAALDCEPLLWTARCVNRSLLEGGFYYEHVPSVFEKLDEHAAPWEGAAAL